LFVVICGISGRCLLGGKSLKKENHEEILNYKDALYRSPCGAGQAVGMSEGCRYAWLAIWWLVLCSSNQIFRFLMEQFTDFQIFGSFHCCLAHYKDL